MIGTHALLSEGVGFGALGLVVIDEQHRFGVAQRARLRDKGDGQGAPHLLVMTATPIPRTLALTAYGDLDASVLDELPPGRKPVATKLGGRQARRGRGVQAASPSASRPASAHMWCARRSRTTARRVDVQRRRRTVPASSRRRGRELRVGLVHGRLDAADRDRVMRAFKQGELDVLVATTVIEVGVDVPDSDGDGDPRRRSVRSRAAPPAARARRARRRRARTAC